MMRPLHFAIAVSALSSGGAVAQSPDSLPRVVITATRVDVATGSTITSAAVLDRAFIERTGATDVAELLRFVPGVQIARSGGPGAQSSIFLRGGENDYVRVLIDGVPVNDPGGAIDLSWLSAGDIERIEVIRGPASVLYGTDAVSGVVQLFTRRGTGPSVEGEIATGRYGSRRLSANAAAGGPRMTVNVGGTSERTDGLLAFNSQYARDVLGAGFQARPSQSTQVDVSLRAVNDEFHFPTDGSGDVTDSNAFRANRKLTAAVSITRTFSSRVNGGLQLTAMNHRAEDGNLPDSPGDTIGFYYYDARSSVRRRAADGRVNILLSSSAVVTLGAEVVREAQRGHDSSNYSFERNRFAADRRNSAVYGQWLSEHGRVSLTAGARYDENNGFGSFRTARAGLAVRAWNGGVLRATAGTAFKAPTFFETFNTAFSTGNADLVPERSRSWEAGLRQTLFNGRISASATWFDQRFHDMIQYAFLSVDQPNYFNVAAASAKGLELEARARLTTRLRAAGTMTRLRTSVDDAGLQSGEAAVFVEGNRLLRRPSTLAAFNLGADLPARVTADVGVTYTGSRDDRDFSGFQTTPVVLPAWTRFDISASKAFQLGAQFGLHARVVNVFNARYEEIANYPAAGRSLTIGLRVR